MTATSTFIGYQSRSRVLLGVPQAGVELEIEHPHPVHCQFISGKPGEGAPLLFIFPDRPDGNPFASEPSRRRIIRGAPALINSRPRDPGNCKAVRLPLVNLWALINWACWVMCPGSGGAFLPSGARKEYIQELFITVQVGDKRNVFMFSSARVFLFKKQRSVVCHS